MTLIDQTFNNFYLSRGLIADCCMLPKFWDNTLMSTVQMIVNVIPDPSSVSSLSLFPNLSPLISSSYLHSPIPLYLPSLSLCSFPMILLLRSPPFFHLSFSRTFYHSSPISLLVLSSLTNPVLLKFLPFINIHLSYSFLSSLSFLYISSICFFLSIYPSSYFSIYPPSLYRC